MTELREQGQRLADALVEIAGFDGRRGVVARALVVADLSPFPRELLLTEAVEVLSRRCSGHRDLGRERPNIDPDHWFAEQAGDALARRFVVLAERDSRRGAVVDGVIDSKLHMQVPLMALVLEALAARCAASPDAWSTNGEVMRHLADHCNDGRTTGDER